MFRNETWPQGDVPLTVPEATVEHFRKYDVPSDGGCLFYAAALGFLSLYREEETFQSHCDKLFGQGAVDPAFLQSYLRAYDESSALLMGESTDGEATLKSLINRTWRKKIVEHMRCHFRDDPDFRGFFNASPEQLEQVLDNYFIGMEQPHAWGGQHEIRAIAQYLGHPIHVYSDNREGGEQKPLVHPCGVNRGQTNPPICLLHGFLTTQSKERTHYYLLRTTVGPVLRSLTNPPRPHEPPKTPPSFLSTEDEGANRHPCASKEGISLGKPPLDPGANEGARLFEEQGSAANDATALNPLENFEEQAGALSTMGLVLSYYRGVFLERCDTLDFLSEGSRWLTLNTHPSFNENVYGGAYLCLCKPLQIKAHPRGFAIPADVVAQLNALQEASYPEIRLLTSTDGLQTHLKKRRIVVVKEAYYVDSDKQSSLGERLVSSIRTITRDIFGLLEDANDEPAEQQERRDVYNVYYQYQSSGPALGIPVSHQSSRHLKIKQAFEQSGEAQRDEDIQKALLPLRKVLYKSIVLRRQVTFHHQLWKCSLILPLYGSDSVSALAHVDLLIAPEKVSVMHDGFDVFYSQQATSSPKDPVKSLGDGITSALNEMMQALSFDQNALPHPGPHHFCVTDRLYHKDGWFPHLFVVEKALQKMDHIIFGKRPGEDTSELVEGVLMKGRVDYIANKHHGVLQRFIREYKTLSSFYAAYEEQVDHLKAMATRLLDTLTHPCFGKVASAQRAADAHLSASQRFLPLTVTTLTQAIEDNSAEGLVFQEALCHLVSAIQKYKKDHSVAEGLAALKKGGTFYYHRLHELSIDNKHPQERNLSALVTDYATFEQQFFPSKPSKPSLPRLAIEKNITITTLRIKSMDFNLPLVHPYRSFGVRWEEEKKVGFFESTAFPHRRLRNCFSRKYAYIGEMSHFITGFTYLKRLEFTNNVFKRALFSEETLDGFALNNNTYKRAIIPWGKNNYFSDTIAQCTHLEALVTDVCPSITSLITLHKQKQRWGLTGFNHLEIHGDMKEYWTQEGIDLLAHLLEPNAIVVFDGQRGTSLTEEWVKPLLVMLRSKEVVALTLDNHLAFLKKANGQRGDGYGLRFLATQMAQGWHLTYLSLRNNALTNEAIYCLSTFLPHNASLLTLCLDNAGDLSPWNEKATLVLLTACEKHPYLSRLNMQGRITKNTTDTIAAAVDSMERTQQWMEAGKRGWPLFVYLGDTQPPGLDGEESFFLGGCDFSEQPASRVVIARYTELKNGFAEQDTSEAKSKALEIELKIYWNRLLRGSKLPEEGKKEKVGYNRLWRLAIYSSLAALMVAGFAASALVSSLHTFGIGGLAHALSGLLATGAAVSLTAQAVFDLIQRLSHKLLAHSLYKVLQEGLQLFWEYLQSSPALHAPLSKEEQKELQRKSQYLREEIKKAYRAEVDLLHHEKAVDQWYLQVLPEIVRSYPPHPSEALPAYPLPAEKNTERNGLISSLLKKGDYRGLKCLLGETLHRQVGAGNIHLFEYEGVPTWSLAGEDRCYREQKRTTWEKEKFERLKASWERHSDSTGFEGAIVDPHQALVAWWTDSGQAVNTLLEMVKGICRAIIHRDDSLNQDKPNSGAPAPLDDLLYYHRAKTAARDGGLTVEPYQWEERAQCLFYFLMVSLCVFRTGNDALEGHLDVFLETLVRLTIRQEGSGHGTIRPFSESALMAYSGLRCFLGDLLATFASMGRLFEGKNEERSQDHSHPEKKSAKTSHCITDNKNNSTVRETFAAHKKAFFKKVVGHTLQIPLENYLEKLSFIPPASNDRTASSPREMDEPWHQTHTMEDKKLYLEQRGAALRYHFKTPLGDVYCGRLTLSTYHMLFLSQYGLNKLKLTLIPQILSRHLALTKRERQYDRRTNRNQLFLYLETFCHEQPHREPWMALAVTLEQVRDNLDGRKRNLFRRAIGNKCDIPRELFLAARELLACEAKALASPGTEEHRPSHGGP